MSNPLAGRDILTMQDFKKEEIELILEQAAWFEAQFQEIPKLDLLAGRVLATMFYEPSTRTRLSFESAMLRLGGGVLSAAEAAKTSSAAKGESLEDAARVVSGYADVIVQRHPEVYSAHKAASGATVPLINAGDGSYEHPTQALLDLYTIQQERGQIDGLRITMVGDLRYGRTVHSLIRALVHWDVSVTLVSPPPLSMSKLIVSKVQREIQIEESEDLIAAIANSDVLYVTRVQRERFKDRAAYERVKNAYIIDRRTISKNNPDITIMHPLPRVNEIKTNVDSLPGAAYFRQSANGVWVRMAILALVLDAVDYVAPADIDKADAGATEAPEEAHEGEA